MNLGDNMIIIRNILYETFKNTVQTVLKLAKIIVPVIFFTTLIKMTGILEVIAKFFEPLVTIFDLPGEATLPLLLGGIVNLYAGIGAMDTLDLNSSQITTISIMMLIAHSLLVETAVISSIGVKKKTQMIIRIGLALIVGFLVSVLMGWIYG